jgi:hypothetical protein
MTRDELQATINGMADGNYASIPYDVYAEIFPPGEPDQEARAACFNFARSLGCRIENKPSLREVWIIKDPIPDRA